MANSIESKKCITPEFRVSFPNVFKPKAFEGQEPKYSVVMLFDKKTDISKLKACANAAAAEKWGTDKSKWPKNMRSPFRDGDEKSDTNGYAGTIYVSASSKQRPGVVDQGKPGVSGPAPITEESGAFYAGCFARASLIAFAYDVSGNRGISFSLQNLQKLKDGQPFSGRKNAEDEFDAVEESIEETADAGNGDGGF